MPQTISAAEWLAQHQHLSIPEWLVQAEVYDAPDSWKSEIYLLKSDELAANFASMESGSKDESDSEHEAGSDDESGSEAQASSETVTASLRDSTSMLEEHGRHEDLDFARLRAILSPEGYQTVLSSLAEEFDMDTEPAVKAEFALKAESASEAESGSDGDAASDDDNASLIDITSDDDTGSEKDAASEADNASIIDTASEDDDISDFDIAPKADTAVKVAVEKSHKRKATPQTSEEEAARTGAGHKKRRLKKLVSEPTPSEAFQALRKEYLELGLKKHQKRVRRLERKFFRLRITREEAGRIAIAHDLINIWQKAESGLDTQLTAKNLNLLGFRYYDDNHNVGLDLLGEIEEAKKDLEKFEKLRRIAEMESDI